MRAFRSARSRVIFATAIAGLLAAGVAWAAAGSDKPEATQTKPGASTVDREAWSADAIRKLSTQKPGCYKIVYPGREVVPVPCVKAPEKPYGPAEGPKPQTVGNGNDFSAKSSGAITSAIGSFDDAKTVAFVFSVPGGFNDYTLQLNTNTFQTPVNSFGCKAPSCRSWEQFIFANNGNTFVQYWLIGHGKPCPPNFIANPAGCFFNSFSFPTPNVSPSDFPKLKLTATVIAGLDIVALDDGAVTISGVVAPDILSIQGKWNTAEYNVFGDCCSSLAVVSPLAHIVVRTEINDGTTNAPTCSNAGFTGETNSLSLIKCCPFGGAKPHIAFDESGFINPSGICKNGTVVGNPNL
jgi:hypothetical protein